MSKILENKLDISNILDHKVLKNNQYSYRVVVPITFALILISALTFKLNSPKANWGNIITYLIIFSLSALFIKYSDIFAAIVQPPLIIFFVTILYVLSRNSVGSLVSKNFALNLIPILAAQFYLMVFCTLVSSIIYIGRKNLQKN